MFHVDTNFVFVTFVSIAIIFRIVVIVNNKNSSRHELLTLCKLHLFVKSLIIENKFK